MGEVWCWFGACGLCRSGPLTWARAAELMDADSGAAAEVEDEAGAGVEESTS